MVVSDINIYDNMFCSVYVFVVLFALIILIDFLITTDDN